MLLSTLFNILLWLWQAPQNLVGLVLKLIYRKDAKRFPGLKYKGINYILSTTLPGSVSLGNYVFIKAKLSIITDTWNHEWGHTRQSRILGPLYLLVIGLPSITWARVYKHLVKKVVYIDSPKRLNYYKFYTERWADKLGGVVRK